MTLSRGRHVLVDKPVSVGVVDAQAMVAAQAAQTVTATCFNFDPAHLEPPHRRVCAGDPAGRCGA